MGSNEKLFWAPKKSITCGLRYWWLFWEHFPIFQSRKKYSRDIKRARRILISATLSPRAQASSRADVITGNTRNLSVAGFRARIIIGCKEVPELVQKAQRNNHANPGRVLLRVHDTDWNSAGLYCYILHLRKDCESVKALNRRCVMVINVALNPSWVVATCEMVTGQKCTTAGSAPESRAARLCAIFTRKYEGLKCLCRLKGNTVLKLLTRSISWWSIMIAGICQQSLTTLPVIPKSFKK